MEQSGSVIWRESYNPYGEGRKKPSQNTDDVGFTGHQKDDFTGLTYMQARYYDPIVGRFYGVDPVGFSNVHNFNRYAYANNNPFKSADPDGQNAKALEWSWKGGWAIGGGINTAVYHVAGITLSTMVANAVWDAVHNESSDSSSGDSNDPVDDMKDKSTPGKKTKGRTTNWNTTGGVDQANDDFDNLVPDGGKEITDGKGGKGRTGVDGKGRKINVRPNSKDGRPTVEVQDGKKRDKFRYDE